MDFAAVGFDQERIDTVGSIEALVEESSTEVPEIIQSQR